MDPKLTDLSTVEVLVKNPLTEQLLTPDCLRLIALLQRLHNSTRKRLLKEREEKVLLLDNGMPMVNYYPLLLFALLFLLFSTLSPPFYLI